MSTIKLKRTLTPSNPSPSSLDEGELALGLGDTPRKLWVGTPAGVQELLTALGGPYLPLTGGTLTGNLNISMADGVAKIISGQTGNLDRWRVLLGDNTAESGNNVGSNFVISRYADTGSVIDSPLTINRASGAVNVVTSDANGGLRATSGGTAAAITALNTSTGRAIDARTVSGNAVYANSSTGNSVHVNMDATTSNGIYIDQRGTAGSGLRMYGRSGSVNNATSAIYIDRGFPGDTQLIFNLLYDGSITTRGPLTIATDYGEFTKPAAIYLYGKQGEANSIFSSKNGNDRWSVVLGDTTAESGGNIGSNFAISRYNDASTLIDSPLIIDRATGTTTFHNQVNLRNPAPWPASCLSIVSAAGAYGIDVVAPATSIGMSVYLTGGRAINVYGTGGGLFIDQPGITDASISLHGSDDPGNTGVMLDVQRWSPSSQSVFTIRSDGSLRISPLVDLVGPALQVAGQITVNVPSGSVWPTNGLLINSTSVVHALSISSTNPASIGMSIYADGIISLAIEGPSTEGIRLDRKSVIGTDILMHGSDDPLNPTIALDVQRWAPSTTSVFRVRSDGSTIISPLNDLVGPALDVVNGTVKVGIPIGPAVTGRGNVNIEGEYYKNGVPLSGGAGPPIDGQLYGMRNSEWVPINIPEIPEDVSIFPLGGQLNIVGSSPSNRLSYAPFNGSWIRINGEDHPIPATGVVGGPTFYVDGVAGVTPTVSTSYFVYLFDNAGTLALDLSTTGHATSATSGNVGTEIKAGDDTRSLVGVVSVASDGLFYADVTAGSRSLVRSWFNRQRVGLNIRDVITSTGALVGSTGISVVLFAGDNLFVSTSGTGIANVAADASFRIQLNATDAAEQIWNHDNNTPISLATSHTSANDQVILVQFALVPTTGQAWATAFLSVTI